MVDEFVETYDAENKAVFDTVDVDGGTPNNNAHDSQDNMLAEFLEWVRLRTDLDAVENKGSSITLMTVHAAKGLEFDNVFVTGLEENVFPHQMNAYDPCGIEEERRLAYVAITRARKNLYLSSASTRKLFGNTQTNPVSRFITEIPSNLCKKSGCGSADFSGCGWERRGSRHGIAGSGTHASFTSQKDANSPYSGKSHTSSDFSDITYTNPNAGKKSAATEVFVKGDVIEHKTFGRGRVLDVKGDMLQIRFEGSNKTKKLLKDYAPIVKIKN